MLVLLLFLSGGLATQPGVEYVKAHGKLTGPNTVQCDLVEGGEQTINAKRILVAAGSEVAPFPGGAIEIDEEKVGMYSFACLQCNANAMQHCTLFDTIATFVNPRPPPSSA